MRRVAALAVAAAAIAAGAGGAAAATLTGAVTGGRVPAPGAGAVDVRAVNLRTLEIAGAADVARTRRWTIRGVPAGTYSVLTSVMRANGTVTEAISAPVRARRAGRVTVATTLRRRRAPAPRPRIRRATELVAHATPTPVVTVRRFAGSGPEAGLGRALAEGLITDLGDGTATCPIRQREGMREDLIAREVALSNSSLADPSQRIVPHPVQATLEVRGSVTTTSDSMTWKVQLVDVATGTVVGGDEGTARGADGIFSEAPGQIADRLLTQICGTRYDVAIQLRTDARFASHTASGTITAVLTAAGARSARGTPPARFSGTGALAYENLAFVPGTECTLTAPVSVPGAWSVELELTPAGRLRVTWDPEAGGVVAGTATSTCPTMPPVPVPGFPGPSLVNPTPRTFELPVDGGSQAIAGGIDAGSQGWSHAGTITVVRLPPP